MTKRLHEEHRQNRVALTPEQIAEIFAMVDSGQATHEAISVFFGVPKQTIANAVHRRNRRRRLEALCG